ncbi:MAG: hypothetical protein DME86_11775 [Verrucomicrobia bacterium]|nr:MAG: hypothetical protein DME86_11775 [Verrucomicrobiota bacterium]
MRPKPLLLACFLLHFLIIVIISCRQTLWLVGHGLTMLPPAFKDYSERAETVVSDALAQNLPPSSPIRRALLTYLHIAGIERPYGYFAPNVPVSYKLVFELHYSDGRVEYEVPGGNTAAADLRLAALLDEIGRTRVDALREYLVKLLARSTWREHPDVEAMRAILGSRNLPSIDEFERGTRESYEFLYAYDFSLEKESSRLESP